ncbi:MAG: hypothetical protein R3D68_00010 [Hyphomicrobiaceae bacterium]
MFHLAAAVIVLVYAAPEAWAQPHADVYARVRQDLLERIQRRTGPNAQSCGDLFKRPVARPDFDPAPVYAAIACGQRAVAAGQSFWFAFGGFGLDSWVAEGLLASPDGPLERFSYDSDPGGGGGVSAHATLSSGRCVGARLHQFSGGGYTLECLNEPWKLVIHAIILGLFVICCGVATILTRRRWRKAAVAVLGLGVVAIAAIIWVLANLGGLRSDLAAPAAICAAILLALLTSRVRSRVSLAA